MSPSVQRVGRVEIIGLSDGTMQGAAASTFPDVPASAWTGSAGDDGADGTLAMNFGCFLLRTPGLTALVDTGVGGTLLDELAAHGIEPGQVQAVAYTHLHGDHIGWNLTGAGEEARLTFPNARYYVPRGDWSHYVDTASAGYNASVHDKFRLAERRGLVELVDDGAALCPELTVWASPGHTPGHCCIMVESDGQRAIIVGDAMIHPVQVGHPEWSSSYDGDPSMAARTRAGLVDRTAREGSLGAVSHFAAPGFGRVVREGVTATWRAE